jgi:hypothetical protein
MSKKRMVWLVVIGIAFWWAAATARAQEATTAKATADDTQKSATAFRIDFALDESEDGKTINTRHYSMNLVPGFTTSNEIKIGTRLPVEGKEGQMQYIDVGTNIWSRMVERGDSLQLEVRADLSNFANPQQENRTTMPLLRQLHISASTVATIGKPTVVGIVDDPNSKRQFLLAVTVTKLK